MPVAEPVTQDELHLACQAWQSRLRLADWRVTVQWRDWVSMRTIGRSGEIEWNIQQKLANIFILPPAQRCDDNQDMTPGCWETTLVHELLHLHLAAWDTDEGSLEDVAKEQAINAISAALVRAVRLGDVALKFEDVDGPGMEE